MDDPQPGALTLEDLDRLFADLENEPLRIDPLCPCAACSSPLS